MKKIIFISVSCLISLVIVRYLIFPNYIFLSSYNHGKSGLVNVNKVESIDLNECDNKEAKLKKISNCKNLKTLFITYNIDNFNFLEGINIESLYITSNCNDWESLECIKEIKELYINPMISNDHSTFNDCSVLRKFHTIEELTITNFNDEINYSGIEELICLKYLAINSSTIDFSDISFPDTVVNLQVQTGYYNKKSNLLINIHELEDTNIKNFSIWNSHISDLSFVNLISSIHTIEFHDCIFYETESEVNTVISDLKKKNVDIILENNTFSE